MSRNTKITSRSRLRRGLLGGCALLAVGLLAVPGSAEASVRTKSTAIAAEADRALDAFARWEIDDNPADYVRFIQSRDAAATMTASDLELDPDALSDAWASAPIVKQRAVLAALSQLGVPYRSIASEPGVGFDCSGLTIWAFGQAGLEIPRTSGDQFRAAEKIESDEAVPGDFVYYPGHISIYLGLGTMVHSPNSGSHVEAVTLPSQRSVDFGDPFGD
ncbi:MAG TPA: C40 family peptidase [Ilumatobacter sp.]|nr:C40 family peptidase [Ilumatobacter sp.]